MPVYVQIEEVREVMGSEMRTQLRRQAAAHTDHLREVLKIQEQELKLEFQQVREGRSIMKWPGTTWHGI